MITLNPIPGIIYFIYFLFTGEGLLLLAVFTRADEFHAGFYTGFCVSKGLTYTLFSDDFSGLLEPPALFYLLIGLELPFLIGLCGDFFNGLALF